MFHGRFQRLIRRKALCQFNSGARRIDGEKSRETFFEAFRSGWKADFPAPQGEALNGLLTTYLYV